GALGHFIRDWKTGEEKAMQFAGFLGATIGRGNALIGTFRMTPVRVVEETEAGGRSDTYEIPNWSVQLTYRSYPKDEHDYGLLVSALGGPVSYGGKVQYESPRAGAEQFGVGALGGGYSFNPSMLYGQADAMQKEISTYFVDVYGWHKEKADKWGYLLAAMWLGAQVNPANPTIDNPETGELNHYGRGLMLGWLGKFSIGMGYEKLPGWANIQKELELMNQQLAERPEQAEQIMRNASTRISQIADLENLMRFTFGIGYDDKVAVKASLDTYRKYGTLSALAYLTDYLYVQVLTSGWYREQVDQELIAFHSFASVGWHRGIMKDAAIDRQIAEIDVKLAKEKDPVKIQKLEEERSALWERKTHYFTDMKFTTGPTLELDWNSKDLALSGWGFRFLTRIFQDENQDMIIGAMGTTPIELERMNLKQYQIVWSHQMKKRALSGDKIDTYYVLVNYSEKKIQVLTKEEYDTETQVYLKTGYEHTELLRKEGTGTSISFGLKVGAVKTEEWNPSVVGAFKYTELMRSSDVSAGVSGGYGPFGVPSSSPRGMDIYDLHRMHSPFNPKGYEDAWWLMLTLEATF
ncbi:MAG: hypothetical protein PHU63_03460, partial [Candidatus ainarchaeum sp.]|nr:hypothetical protein [Candidatus ainarchaeum sp.]